MICSFLQAMILTGSLPVCDWCIAPQKLEWCMDFLWAECDQLVLSLAAHLKWHEAAKEVIFLVLSSNQWRHKKLLRVWRWEGASERGGSFQVLWAWHHFVRGVKRKGRAWAISCDQRCDLGWTSICFRRIIQEGVGRNPPTARFSVEAFPSLLTRFIIIRVWWWGRQMRHKNNYFKKTGKHCPLGIYHMFELHDAMEQGPLISASLRQTYKGWSRCCPWWVEGKKVSLFHLAAILEPP